MPGFENQEYKGMRIGDVLEPTVLLVVILANLIEHLVQLRVLSPHFILWGSDIFDACNQKYSNPQTQSDITPMPMGYVYDKCIPPEVSIFGNGSGATAVPIVNYQRKIISVLITNPDLI